MLVLWIAGKFSGDQHLPRTAEFLGIASGALSIVALWVTAFLCNPSQRYSVLNLVPSLLLFSSFSFLFWSGQGLETTFYTLLIILTLLVLKLSIGNPRLLPLCSLGCALVALTRPEGIILFGAVLAVLVVWPLGGSRSHVLLQLTIPFAILFGSWLFWMKAYYGDFLYNSIYVKNGGTLFHLKSGLRYIKTWFGDGYALPLLVFPALVSLRHIIRGPNRFNLVLLTYLAAYLVFVAYVGGDYMPESRLLVPLLPVSYLLLWQGVVHILQYLRGRYLRNLAIIACCLLPIALFTVSAATTSKNTSVLEQRQLMGEYLREEYPSNTLTLIPTAGAIPYFAELPNIDGSGINDRHIALYGKQVLRIGHGRTDAAYALSREPQITILEDQLVPTEELADAVIGRCQPWNAICLDIVSQPDFGLCYEPNIVELQNDLWFVFHVRNGACDI